MGKRRVSGFLKENKHLWFMVIYGVLYLISFVLLEYSEVPVNRIHCTLDERIPFCEYFIIPYVLWFFFVGATVCFFAFRCRSRAEYWRLAVTLCTGMTVFLILSFVYPNGHSLRPELNGDSIFIKAVSVLYYLDTPTNILPSLHVFEAAACCIALLENREFRERKGLAAGTVILTVCIVASTVLLKQHSVVDVLLAAGMNMICYAAFYRIAPGYEEKMKSCFTRRELCTIPNFLSLFRLLLAVILAGFICRWEMAERKGLMTAIVLVSGITDFLDGKIARRFDMVSEVGKILDPIADKVTQGVLLLCFINHYPIVRPLFILFVAKEAFMAAAGTRSIARTHKNEGAMWYGKVNTAVFYGVMAVLIFGGDIPKNAADLLLMFSAFWMVLSWLLYAKKYWKILHLKRSRRQA